MSDYKTVRDLLRGSATAELEIGFGSSHAAHHFDNKDPVLSHAVFRSNFRGSLDHALKNTSSLTPPSSLCVGTNLGQPLLVDDRNNLSIHLYKSGLPLQKIVSFSSAEDRLQAILDLAETTRTNPFLYYIRRAIKVYDSGFLADTNLGNTVLDLEAGTLDLLDQIVPNRYNENITDRELFSYNETIIDAICRALTSEKALKPKHGESEAYRKVCALITSARDQLYKEYDGKTTPDPYEFVRANSQEEYHCFDRVCSNQAVSLDDPPHVLIERIRQLHTFIDAPRVGHKQR